MLNTCYIYIYEYKHTYCWYITRCLPPENSSKIRKHPALQPGKDDELNAFVAMSGGRPWGDVPPEGILGFSTRDCHFSSLENGDFIWCNHINPWKLMRMFKDRLQQQNWFWVLWKFGELLTSWSPQSPLVPGGDPQGKCSNPPADLDWFRDTLLSDKLMGEKIWLVVWLPFFIFPYIGNVIIPIDELIFFRGVAQPPTRDSVIFILFPNWNASHMH